MKFLECTLVTSLGDEHAAAVPCSVYKIARTSATLFIPRLVSTTSSVSMTLALRFLPLDLPWNLTNALVRFSVWFDARAHRSQCTEMTRLVPCAPCRSAGLRTTADNCGFSRAIPISGAPLLTTLDASTHSSSCSRLTLLGCFCSRARHDSITITLGLVPITRMRS